MFEKSYSFPENHRSLEGHFPDHPVIPGVLILEAVLDTLKQAYSDKNIYFASAPSVKFMTPLLPEQDFMIHLHKLSENQFKFSCDNAEYQFASGKITVTAKD